MKILFVIPYVPSLIRVRPYQLLRGLAERGHSINLVTLWSNESERKSLDELTPYCEQIVSMPLSRWRSFANCLQALPSRTPLQAVYSWQPELAKYLSGITTECNGDCPVDVIHIEHLRGVRYGVRLKADQPEIPIVWDSVDCISHLFKQAATHSAHWANRLLTRFELARTQPYEGAVAPHFNRVLVTSQSDRSALANLVSPVEEARFTVLPNGVDQGYFSPDPGVTRDPCTLVISGKMSYHANVTMTRYQVEEVMPRIWARVPDIRLWIVGKDPPRSIAAYHDHPLITVTGTVQDIRPYLRQAAIAVAPLQYGAGIQNKVLEAMACATPVVTTSQAAASLQAIPGEELLVADGADDFAARVLDLLRNPAYRNRIGQAGRRYVEQHHQWGRISAQLEGIYNEVVFN